MESQFPDLPAQVAGVRLAEIFRMLSKQADEEVDAAEVAMAQPGQPRPTSGSISTSYRLDMHPMLYASLAIANLAAQIPEAI